MSEPSGSSCPIIRDAVIALSKGLRTHSRGIKTTLLTLLVVGILAAIATLGIHYGMGFDNLNKWVGTMKCGPYLGAGLGAAIILFIGTTGKAIHMTLPKAERAKTLTTDDFEPTDFFPKEGEGEAQK